MSHGLILFLIGGWALWLFACARERARNAQLHQAMEAKMKLAESKSLQLERQIDKLQCDAEVLRKNLNEENEAKNAALARWHETLRKGVAAAFCCLFAGLFLGGTLGWLWRETAVTAASGRHVRDLELNERIAFLKTELLEKEMARLKSDYLTVEKNRQDLEVEKAVLQTKLEILLKHIVVEKWGRGFHFNYDKMKKALEENEQEPVRAKNNAGEFPTPMARLSS